MAVEWDAQVHPPTFHQPWRTAKARPAEPEQATAPEEAVAATGKSLSLFSERLWLHRLILLTGQAELYCRLSWRSLLKVKAHLWLYPEESPTLASPSPLPMTAVRVRLPRVPRAPDEHRRGSSRAAVRGHEPGLRAARAGGVGAGGRR